MDLLSALFIIVSFAFLILFFVFLFYNSFFPIICLALFIAFQLLGIFLFKTFVGIVNKRMNEEHFKLSKRISSHSFKRNDSLCFTKRDDWCISSFGIDTRFALKGAVFKKAFIEAFVVRALRYPVISNQKPILYIGRRKLKISSNIDSLTIIFINGKRVTKKQIVKKRISTFGLNAWLITIIRTPQSRTYRYSISFSDGGKNIEKLDEKRFSSF